MVALYYHGGSGNHGCEALVRATKKILNRELTLFSSAPQEDFQYGLDSVVSIRGDVGRKLPKKSPAYFLAAVSHRIRRDDYWYTRLTHSEILKAVHKGDVCLSIGGDNYCYGQEGNRILGYYNRMLRSRGAKTVLWGCSVEPEAMTPAVVEDMRRYSLITARESLTYAALKSAGLTRVCLVPDPAFQLDPEETPLPGALRRGQTVGINVSPLAAGYGSLVLDNYRALVRYILKETDLDVLLLPHVVKKETDDRTVLRDLLNEFGASPRFAMAEDQSCMKLKGMISRCRFFVGARTHATIAAYSTCVPTLAAGYSIKARGIATDLFGTEGNYVVPVQSFTTASDLKNAFLWLTENERTVKSRLEEIMPRYCARAYDGAKAIEELMNHG